MTAVLGRMATYSGKVVKWDDAVAKGTSEFPAKLAWDAEAPGQAGQERQTTRSPCPAFSASRRRCVTGELGGLLPSPGIYARVYGREMTLDPAPLRGPDRRGDLPRPTVQA